MAFPRVIAIVGPTASGKSAVALELAKKIKGEIVNADSRQIYKYLDAGTSKPTLREREIAPHHLYDFLEPDKIYSAGDYLKDAGKVLSQILKRRLCPIVTGGTGLYIRALFEGISILPKRDETIRAQWLAMAGEKGREYLHRRLQEVDPLSASKIPCRNMQRVIRALEVHAITGKPLSYWHAEKIEKGVHVKPVIVGLLWEKQKLRERILLRTKKNLPEIVREMEELLKKGFHPSSPGLQSLGYRDAARFIRKEISYEELLNALLLDTTHYAKRQMTWFNRDKQIRWIAMTEPFDPEAVAMQIVSFL